MHRHGVPGDKFGVTVSRMRSMVL